MKLVVQRVHSASVAVEGTIVGRCGKGLFVLCGAGRETTETEVRKLADRVAGMRIFNDSEGKMNLSLVELPESDQSQVLVVSNFTLYGDAIGSRRPSFVKSAPYEEGKRLYDLFVSELAPRVRGLETGMFGEHMDVTIEADGPVTIIF